MPIWLPYVLLVTVLGFFGLLYDNQDSEPTKQLSIFVSVGCFFFFFAFRGFILSDWIIYYQYFYHCDFHDITDYTIGSENHWEPGFTTLNILCRRIYRNYFFFQFVVCFINTTLLLNFFKRYVKNIPLALMLYVTFEGLVISTNLMRNSIAICIFLNALPYIQQRKPIPYFLLCAVATTFHVTAIIFLPLYFFFHRLMNRWMFLGIFLACNIVYLGHFSIFLTVAKILGIDEQFAMRIRAYTKLYNESSSISIGYLERLLTGSLVFLYYNRLKEIRGQNAIMVNGLIAYFIMYFFLSEFSVMSKRFATLFAYGYWIIWIDLIQCFAIRNNRRLFKAFVFLYCILRMMGSANLPDFKYDNLLFGIKSYQERLYIHNKTFEEP